MKVAIALAAALLVVAGPVVAAPARTAPGNVAVLVVDDFGLGHDDKARPGTRNDNCTVGTNEVGSNGAGDDLPASAPPHGDLVYRVLGDALTGTLGAPPVASTPTTTDWSYPAGGARVTVRLVAVHTDRYRTDDILDGLRDGIATLRGQRFDRFVLNLSFAVIPCDVVGWLTGAGLDELLRTYDEMIDDDPTSALKAALQGYLDASGRLDPARVRGGDFTMTVLREAALAPLRPYLTGAYYRAADLARFPGKDGPLSTVYRDPAWSSFSTRLIQPGTTGAALKIIPVAAAGNGVRYPGDKGSSLRRGLPFPFAPGLWDFVVSAGADTSPEVAARLNAGEVALDATGPAVVPGSFGTSFAAPRLSALEARYLAETGTVLCGGTPPLGYVDLSTGPVLDLTVDSPWKNLGKAEWPRLCADFPR